MQLIIILNVDAWLGSEVQVCSYVNVATMYIAGWNYLHAKRKALEILTHASVYANGYVVHSYISY